VTADGFLIVNSITRTVFAALALDASLWEPASAQGVLRIGMTASDIPLVLEFLADMMAKRKACHCERRKANPDQARTCGPRLLRFARNDRTDASC
jgi:hypothetical protein